MTEMPLAGHSRRAAGAVIWRGRWGLWVWTHGFTSYGNAFRWIYRGWTCIGSRKIV